MSMIDDLLNSSPDDDDVDMKKTAQQKSRQRVQKGNATRMHQLKAGSAEFHYAQQYRTPFTERRKKTIVMLLAAFPVVAAYFLVKIVDMGEFGQNTQWATFLAILSYGVGLYFLKTTDAEDMIPPSMVDED